MIPALPLLAVHLLVQGAAVATDPSCPPEGFTRARLLQLKASRFEGLESGERNRLAVGLLSCLADPDPAIRDGVVFEGLSTWLRGKALSPETILYLERSLAETLNGPRDEAGFRHPFAALILSEVARADRIEAVFPDAARRSLVESAAASLERVDDYRGFDPKEGWRHGVAHGADLVLQLGLNPHVGPDGLRRLMQAVSKQIAPKGEVFYTFGEPERLARAVFFIYRRGALDPAFWEAWTMERADPAPLSNWGTAFQSLEGLARRHNTLAFLQALSFAGRDAGDEDGLKIAILADRAIAQIVGS